MTTSRRREWRWPKGHQSRTTTGSDRQVRLEVGPCLASAAAAEADRGWCPTLHACGSGAPV